MWALDWGRDSEPSGIDCELPVTQDEAAIKIMSPDSTSHDDTASTSARTPQQKKSWADLSEDWNSDSDSDFFAFGGASSLNGAGSEAAGQHYQREALAPAGRGSGCVSAGDSACGSWASCSSSGAAGGNQAFCAVLAPEPRTAWGRSEASASSSGRARGFNAKGAPGGGSRKNGVVASGVHAETNAGETAGVEPRPPCPAFWRSEAESLSDDERLWAADEGNSKTSSEGSLTSLNIEQIRASPRWSVGSEAHLSGDCRPCIFFPKPVGCDNGRNCVYCHLDHPPRVRHRRHRPRRAGRKGGVLDTMAEAGEESDEDDTASTGGTTCTLESQAESDFHNTASGAGSHSEPQRRKRSSAPAILAAPGAGSCSASSSSSRAPLSGYGVADDDVSRHVTLPDAVDTVLNSTLSSLFAPLFRGRGGDQPGIAPLIPERITRGGATSSFDCSPALPSNESTMPWREVYEETPSEDERAWNETRQRSKRRSFPAARPPLELLGLQLQGAEPGESTSCSPVNLQHALPAVGRGSGAGAPFPTAAPFAPPCVHAAPGSWGQANGSAQPPRLPVFARRSPKSNEQQK